jgi:hypothetical protein
MNRLLKSPYSFKNRMIMYDGPPRSARRARAR